MDFRGSDGIDQLPVAETPEDVAVLYSWANLHGAKYRDFSASRREYRAHLRHKAAEEMRETQLKAKVEAERAAEAADSKVSAAKSSAGLRNAVASEALRESAEREAAEASRIAHAERLEAARRSAAALKAEEQFRAEEREIAEAAASARRQAAHYAESEVRRRDFNMQSYVPGRTNDPYTPAEQTNPDNSLRRQQEPEAKAGQGGLGRQFRRPEGYHPDEASGVREIYRNPMTPADLYDERRRRVDREDFDRNAAASPAPSSSWSQRTSAEPRRSDTGRSQDPPDFQRQRSGGPSAPKPGSWPLVENERNSFSRGPVGRPVAGTSPTADEVSHAAHVLAQENAHTEGVRQRAAPQTALAPGAPWGQPATDRTGGPGGFPRDTRSQHRGETGPDRDAFAPARPENPASGRSPQPQEPVAPAWLYSAQPPSGRAAAPLASEPPPQQSSVADTLQHSRERVASRWFALKGVFEQPGADRQADPALRQKEVRTPVLAVFSLAGGVGKTSLVATLGRSLSSLGEKVLLADTTSHGLLPYYFGASELRQGVVRTFSPPSGSTDAPIYLVSYDVDQHGGDEAAQEALVEEITVNGRGTHRILLDLSPNSGWIVRRMIKLNPTILVPVAADMNSVITLQTVEKYLQWTTAPDGQPVRPYYVLNQFDAALPLHLDVREVLRRQLGDRLLPFVIRRAPAVSESLAEGMTVLDYAPDAPVVDDYKTLATWLRNVSAPATAGFRNVRWSER